MSGDEAEMSTNRMPEVQAEETTEEMFHRPQRGTKNPDCSLSPTSQISPGPHISQMQLENGKLTTDCPNEALIGGICQFL